LRVNAGAEASSTSSIPSRGKKKTRKERVGR
jgi:hypothetical protein